MQNSILFSVAVILEVISIAVKRGTIISFMAVIIASSYFFVHANLPLYGYSALTIYYIALNFVYGNMKMGSPTIKITPTHRYVRMSGLATCLAIQVISFWFASCLIIEIKREDNIHTATEKIECFPIGHIYQDEWGFSTCMYKIEQLTPNADNFFSLTNSQLDWVTYTYIVNWLMWVACSTFYIVFLTAIQHIKLHYTNNLALVVWIVIFINLAVYFSTTRDIYSEVGTSTTKTYVGPSIFIQLLTFLVFMIVDLYFIIASHTKHKSS